ncbi:uncharacterized protein [Trachinotus anak]|uniref:uncharacterized protein n=1 Tax=Trachinotus anak TaxID=443729 RepID=UPI0039F1F59F
MRYLVHQSLLGLLQNLQEGDHRDPDQKMNLKEQLSLIFSLRFSVPVKKSPEFPCTGRSEANYLDVSSTCRSEEEEEEQQEEEEGSISDWSEEDLSLHFSPSVILPSEDEESDPESSFKCVDVTVETKVAGHEGEVLRMVPKRQIHLKKKKDIISEKTEKLQGILKDEPAEGGGANSEVSANELLYPTVHHRPDLLLRQHSMPASFCTRDVDSYRVYKGLVAGASQGYQVGRRSEALRRLQKSVSLDETKTKMASCIIKSVLSKKMQVEQSNTKTSHFKKKSEMLPGPPQPADQQTVREGGEVGGCVFKAPVHVVRDVRSLVKNTYNLSFSTATTPENYKPKIFKVIGQEDSPPPTYQQAVGVKGHHKTNSTKGHVSNVAASLSQSHDRKQSNTLSRPITQQRRGSEPIISRVKVDDVTLPVMVFDPPPPSSSPVSQSEGIRGVSHQAGASLPLLSSSSNPLFPPLPLKTPRGPSLLSLPRNSTPSRVFPVSLPLLPPSSSSTHVSTPLPTLHPHLGKLSYVHSPMNYIQIQLQPSPPVPTLHLLRTSEDNQKRSTGNTLDQPDCCMKSCPPQQTRTRGAQEGHLTPATQTQQQPFMCSVQGFLPAQVGSDFLVDITGSAAPPGGLLSGPAPYNMMLEPQGGRCYYVDTPPQPQRKMLLDPETGQFIQVFIPVTSSAPNTTVFPVCCPNPAPTITNPAPTMLQMGSANPTIVSVMRFQPTMAFPSLYTPPCLPFTLHTPSGNFTDTAP